MTDRLPPTPEDLVIVQRNLKRLQRWCREAGQSEKGPRAVLVCKNFVFDMVGTNPEELK